MAEVITSQVENGHLEIPIKNDEIAKWNKKLEYAKDKHKKEYLENAQLVKMYFEGKHWLSKTALRINSSSFVQLTDNRVFANIQAELPRLYYADPKIVMSHEESFIASILNRFANKLYKNLKCKENIRKIIQDALMFNYGWVKCGYHSEFGYEVKPIEGTTDVVVTDNQTGEQTVKSAPDIATEDSKAQGYNEFIQEEFPFAKRVSGENLIMDPESTPPYEDSKFKIEIIVRPYDDVVADSMYEIIGDLPASYYDEEYRKVDVNNGQDNRKEEYKTVVLYEIHYKKRENGKLNYYILTLAKGHDKPLRHVKSEYNFFPYKPLYFNLIPDETYGFSDAMQYLPLQDALNLLESCQMTHVLRSLPKMTLETGGMVVSDKDKLKEGNIDMVLETTKPDALKPLQQASLSNDFYNLEGLVKGNINEIGAISTNQRGQTSGDTATEISIVQGNIDIRANDRLQRVAEFIKDITEMILKISFKFFPENKYTELLGPEEGAILWKLVQEDKIKDYETRIDITSMVKIDDNVKIKLSADRYDRLINNPLIKKKKITEDYIKATKELLPDYGDVNDYFVPEVLGPDAELVKILNMLLMGQDPQVHVQPGEDLEDHFMVHKAQLQTPIVQGEQSVMQYLMMHVAETEEALGLGSTGAKGGNTVQSTQGFPDGNKLATNVNSIPMTSN